MLVASQSQPGMWDAVTNMVFRTLKEVQNIMDVMHTDEGCNHVSRQFAASIISLCGDCVDVYMLTVTAPSKLPHLSSKFSVVMAAVNDLRCNTRYNISEHVCDALAVVAGKIHVLCDILSFE